jgi:hypothetical protein
MPCLAAKVKLCKFGQANFSLIISAGIVLDSNFRSGRQVRFRDKTSAPLPIIQVRNASSAAGRLGTKVD